MKVHADFENHFKDLTLEPFVYEFNEEEDIEGHKFVHVRDGVFRAEPVFCVTRQEIKRLSRIYRDVKFYGFYTEDLFEVWFALSETGCILNSWNWYDGARRQEDLKNWKWWEEDEEEVAERAIVNSEHELDYVKFENEGMFVVCEDEEDAKLLPEKKMAFNFKYQRVVREDGTVPRIMINGCIADMVEPGIYYFSRESKRGVPMVTTATSFGNMDVAAVANFDYGITMNIFLHYVATDKKYFGRLKELANNMNGYIYHEFRKVNPEEIVEEEPVSLDDVFKEQEERSNWYEEELKKKEKQKQELIRELGGEELMEGLGTTEIKLCFEIPLVKKCPFKEYEYVAKKGDMLILVHEDYEQWHSNKKTFVVDYYDMRLMTYLEVKQTVMLRCGYEYDVMHKIIDCREEKYKEMLTPEAYALFNEQRKRMKNNEMS